METETDISGAPPPTNETQAQPAPITEEDDSRHRKGKIARLPREQRDEFNLMLADNRPYAEIIEKFRTILPDLNEMNISRWRKTSFKEWLQHNDWLDQLTIKWEMARDIVSQDKAVNIHEANLHILATQMYDRLLGCDINSLPEALKKNPENFIRMVNTLSRMAQQALNFQRYRDACTQARAEVQKLLDPKRELTEEERRAIVDKVDRILGIK
jgi:hypothetical protein